MKVRNTVQLSRMLLLALKCSQKHRVELAQVFLLWGIMDECEGSPKPLQFYAKFGVNVDISGERLSLSLDFQRSS